MGPVPGILAPRACLYMYTFLPLKIVQGVFLVSHHFFISCEEAPEHRPSAEIALTYAQKRRGVMPMRPMTSYS